MEGKKENNWWEHDPEGLQEKLKLLVKHNKTPEEIAKMYSHDKGSVVKRKSVNEQIKLEL